VDAHGALIGINTAIFSETGGYMGIGFAVAVNMMRSVVDQIVTRGNLTRGYLGAAMQDTTGSRQPPRRGGRDRRTQGISVTNVTPELARRLGLPPGVRGVVVAEVLPGGPAAEAGLRPGDVIQEVDRRPVRSAAEFTEAMARAGRRDVAVLVNRGGSTAYAVIERGT
jgi:S1-C subfamily serine protease